MGILHRLTYILIAVFITVTIFATLQNLLGNWGVLLALIINLVVATKVLKMSPKGSTKRVMALSILWTIGVTALILAIGVSTISYTINQIL